MKNSNKTKAKRALKFFELAEKLKQEERNAWLSNERKESVAEHTWRMSLMATIISHDINLDVDWCKILEMITIHDIAEIETGDIPREIQTKKVIAEKAEKEMIAALNIKNKIQGTAGDAIYNLWQEFEDQKTNEAKIVKVLDHLEAVIQKYQFSEKRWKTLKDHQKKGNSDNFFKKLVKRSKIDDFLFEIVDQALEKRFERK